MEKYISKSAVNAEIKRLLKSAEAYLKYHHDINNKSVYAFRQQQLVMCELLSFLDTLEVKEVDLEKEINKYISDNFFGSQTLGFFANRTKEEPNDQDIALCAKHFFELGLRAAQKGE